jgi:hypothetical protein
MLLWPATCNCGRNIGPLFRITAAKLQNTKIRALPHSGSGNRPLPLLRVQLRPLPPLFITLRVLRIRSLSGTRRRDYGRQARLNAAEARAVFCRRIIRCSGAHLLVRSIDGDVGHYLLLRTIAGVGRFLGTLWSISGDRSVRTMRDWDVSFVIWQTISEGSPTTWKLQDCKGSDSSMVSGDLATNNFRLSVACLPWRSLCFIFVSKKLSAS